MPYGNWDESFQDVWEHIPGTAHLEDFERPHAEALFEAGFTHRNEEYDALGLTPGDVAAIREEFFDFMGLDDSDFDWEEWRDAMGYLE